MKKFLLSIFAVLFAFAGVQAETVTLNASDVVGKGKEGGGGGFEYTVSPISFNFSSAYGDSNTELRFYKGSTLEISGATITKVQFTAASSKYGGTVTANSGSITVDELTQTWEGSTTSLIITATGSQIRTESIVVTYTTTGGGETPEPETPTTSEIVATYELTQENMASEWSGTTSYENKTIECSYGSWTGYFNFTKSGTTYALGLNGSANLQSPVSYGAVKSVSIVITNGSASARNIVLTGGSESKTISVPSKTTTEIVFDGFETEFYSFTLTASGALQISSIEVVCPPSYTLSVSDAGWATMFLGFDAEIVDGAKAYIVKTEGVSADKVTLTEITGTIPANTGVIVKAEQGVYEFNYSAENVADVTGNLLEGTATATEINVEAYVLGKVDGVVGLYKAEMNQMDGTAWLNNANKAFLPASALTPAQQTAAFYGFDWDGTTGIEQITDNREQSTAIYDLTGRRIEAITAPGIYVVNGKKILVK